MSTRIDDLHPSCGETHPAAAVSSATQLMELASKQVPAYRKILRDRETSIDGVSYISAPVLSKDNYFSIHSLQDRSWNGVVDHVSFIHCSSGSTGYPTLWPRTLQAELTVATTFERVFNDAFEAKTTSTLAVVVFPLGSWVGGMFTTVCVNYLAMKGYKVALVTPGNNMSDILRLIPALAPSFQQTVILGYPPFVKSVIDAGLAAGVPWPSYDLGLVLAGEVYSEEWRALVAHRGGVQRSHQRIVSLYGTADAGVIAAESTLSACIRTWLAAHPQHVQELFGAERLPTLCQYDPANRLLDRHPEDGSLVVTCLTPAALAAPHIEPAAAGPPVLKYGIGDAGGILSYEGMRAFLIERGMDFEAAAQTGSRVRRLPFVWVFGRAFWCVSVYGANVFVENIMSGMEKLDVAELVSGKFVLLVEEDSNLDKQLLVRVECAQSSAPADHIAAAVSESITAELLRLNSEYAHYVPRDRQAVKVLLHPFGDPKWFPVGVKHRYTIQ